MAMEIVNGFPCKTCTDVDNAKKHIDPAHPKDGPYGLNNPEKLAKASHDKAIKFGGVLSELNNAQARSAPSPAIAGQVAVGSLVNLTA